MANTGRMTNKDSLYENNHPDFGHSPAKHNKNKNNKRGMTCFLYNCKVKFSFYNYITLKEINLSLPIPNCGPYHQPQRL